MLLIYMIHDICFRSDSRRGHVSYFPVTVIVIMISAMFIFKFSPKLKDKHYIKHYDCHYDYDRKTRYIKSVL